jgi:hypothetical protein
MNEDGCWLMDDNSEDAILEGEFPRIYEFCLAWLMKHNYSMDILEILTGY